MTRKYDTLIYFQGYVVKGAVTLWLSVDESSKQELQNSGSGRGRLSSTLSIITRWYGHGRPSLSISRVCVNGEANLWPWWVLRKKPPKKTNSWWNFKLRKLVSCRLFITGWRRIRSCRLLVERWGHMNSGLLLVGEWRRVIWDMKETQIPK